MTHPYASLPPDAFWRSGVAESPRARSSTSDAEIRDFAGGADRHLRLVLRPAHRRGVAGEGFGWLQTEPPPRGLSAENAKAHGYRPVHLPHRQYLHRRDAAAVDALGARSRRAAGRVLGRTTGAGSIRSARRSSPADSTRGRRRRRCVISRSARSRGRCARPRFSCSRSASPKAGAIPRAATSDQICPGTREGQFDADAHRFHNADYGEILDDLGAAMDAMTRVNPRIRFLLTVSPVALAATASGKHVLVATTEIESDSARGRRRAHPPARRRRLFPLLRAGVECGARRRPARRGSAQRQPRRRRRGDGRVLRRARRSAAAAPTAEERRRRWRRRAATRSFLRRRSRRGPNRPRKRRPGAR